MPAAIAIAATTIAAAPVTRQRRGSRTRSAATAVFVFRLVIDAEKLYPEKNDAPEAVAPGALWVEPDDAMLELELHADSQDARRDDLIDGPEGP